MAQPRNDEKALKMRELYDKGYSLERVGEAFEVTGSSVFHMFKLRGWECRQPGRKLDPADLVELGITRQETGSQDG